MGSPSLRIPPDLETGMIHPESLIGKSADLEFHVVLGYGHAVAVRSPDCHDLEGLCRPFVLFPSESNRELNYLFSGGAVRILPTKFVNLIRHYVSGTVSLAPDACAQEHLHRRLLILQPQEGLVVEVPLILTVAPDVV